MPRITRARGIKQPTRKGSGARLAPRRAPYHEVPSPDEVVKGSYGLETPEQQVARRAAEVLFYLEKAERDPAFREGLKGGVTQSVQPYRASRRPPARYQPSDFRK